MSTFVIFAVAILSVLVSLFATVYGGIKIYNKYSAKHLVLYVGALVLLVFVICNIKVEPQYYFCDNNEKLGHLEKMVDGTWTTVYWHPIDRSRLVKQISMPGVTHQDFTHVSLPSYDRYCTKKSCTIPVMLGHRYVSYIMWQSLKRLKNELGNIKYFPKIYEMDESTYTYVQEYIPYELAKDTCPKDYTDQIKDFNKILEEKGYYLDDVHSKNWRVAADGTLKVIDCEVYTKTELLIQQAILDAIDGSQKTKASGHVDGHNILHWDDGRPSIYDTC